MRISTWLSPLALAAFMAVSPASHAQAAPAGPLPSVQDAVANVQHFYDQTQTFQSDFDQHYLAKAYNQTKDSTGHVTFSKPGKMNWVYNNPQGNRIVSDGTTIWVYDATNKQVAQQPVAQSAIPSVLSFLSGQGKLDRDYTFEISNDPKFNFPGGYVLIGTPKQANPSVTKVLFYVDSATSQIRRGMVIDGQGNRNTFTFKNPQVNTPVNPADFKFNAPAGTTVVNPGNLPGNSGGGAKP